MRTIYLTEENLKEVQDECKSYIRSCGEDYGTIPNDWADMLNSGIFHDAIGKIVSIDAYSVTITTTY